MLSKNQFLVLNALRKDSEHKLTSQAAIAKETDLSVGTINSTLKVLRNRDWVDGNTLSITASGLEQLAPYKVQNAIIMAAGFSSRFAPLSYEKPKGLLKVRNEVLIERQIEQLQEAGITDITVVVGYLKELFFYLGDKYNVDIVINDEYETRNNHSSLYRVREQLGRTFICSSDNYFSENVFEPYVYEAYYAGVYAEGPTDEWCMTTGSRDVITKVTHGGYDSWYMMGQAYYDESFSNRMAQILSDEYNLPATRDKLWEQLYVDHLNELRMVLRRYPDGIIWEFDSLDDLCSFDTDFINNVDSSIIENIATVLKCERTEIEDIEPLKLGMTNLSCKFRVKNDYYVYRYPGAGTKRTINRASEAHSENIASELGIDTTFIYEDPITGWKISEYIFTTDSFDYKNPLHIEQAMNLARRIHTEGGITPYKADIREDTEKIIPFVIDGDRASYEDFLQMYSTFQELCYLVEKDNVNPCLCHNDLYAPNFLIHGEHMDLIDWEYSGMGDYAGDLGTFICCNPDFSYEDVLNVLKIYFKREPSAQETRHCLAYVSITAFRWYVWSLYQDMIGKPLDEIQYCWYKYAKNYGKRAHELYLLTD